MIIIDIPAPNFSATIRLTATGGQTETQNVPRNKKCRLKQPQTAFCLLY